MRVALMAAVFTVLLPSAMPSEAAGEDGDTQVADFQAGTGQSGAPVTPFVIDVDLRDLPAPPEWRPGDPIHEVPKRRYLPPGTVLPTPVESRDPLVDRQAGYSPASLMRAASGFTMPTRNFSGIVFTGSGVPDTIGDVGKDHIIQSTNGGTRVQIWDKATPTPNLLATFAMDSLGTGACASGFGDPVVIYDRNAERWVLMEFVTSGTNLCVYVSQTSDPVTGGWYAYSFVPPSFPDYPKLAAWPTDANGSSGSYVVTANAGAAVYAMERGPMLSGQAADFQIFDLPNLPGFGFQSATAADIDGPALPPSGAPAVVMRHRDTEVHNGPAAPGDLLEMWALDVDWLDAGNSSISALASIDVAEFSSDLCGLTSFSCIQQPNTSTRLDPLREVIMNRLQYMNHDNEFETLVGNFVVDVSGTDQGGIRWFELRRTGGAAGAWALHQEGTYSIDTDSRWMGASSMDQSGNIALAYNVSSTTTFPGLRYTGRQADDPSGVMTAAETSIVEGSSRSGTNRYGDYAAMGLDPEDDCTFWFVGEYNVSTNWSTRWASLKFEQCGCLLQPTPPSLTATADEDNRVDLSWGDADLDSVIAYEVRRARSAGGPYETIAVIDDVSPGFAGGPGYGYTDLDVSGGIPYYYTVVATDGGPCKSDPLNEVAVVPTGICLLPPLFNGAVDAQVNISGTCGVAVSWGSAIPECGTGVRFNLYRSTDPGFVPGPANLVAGGITGSTVLDLNDLQSGVEYFYAVRALDPSNLVEDLNLAKVSVVAGGTGGQQTFFSEDFESAAALDSWTVTTGPGFHRCGEWDLSTDGNRRPENGSGQYVIANSFDCTELLPATSASLDSPAIDLSSPFIGAVILDIDVYYNHFNGDDATVEVWNGAQWVVIWSDPNADVDTTLSLDVSAHALGNPGFRVRFNYQNANADRWFSVDNVRVGVELICSTAPAPIPAPNGDAATSPLRGDRLSFAGDSIEVTWDAASCGSGAFNLLYGDLAAVGSHALLGSECAVSSSGSFTWSSVPAGSLYFLIVGSDGASTESSWGLSTFGERNGLSPSGECGVSSKTVSASCPLN